MLSSASSAAGAAMGMGGGGYAHQPPPQRAVFTAAQWAELEQQALIYKYLMAGVPVPPDLLLPVRPGPAAAFSFAGPAAASPFYHQHHPSRELSPLSLPPPIVPCVHIHIRNLRSSACVRAVTGWLGIGAIYLVG
jgi:hypothetical protein